MADIDIQGARNYYYDYVHRKGGHPRWRGIRLVKFPTDMVLYAEAIWRNRPDWIIEIGTRFGGSALFFADMLSLSGGKGVVTIDIEKRWVLNHPLITYIDGDSLDPNVIKKVRSIVSGRVMMSIDGNHRMNHVIKEMRAYSSMVSKRQFMVVEDCYTNKAEKYGPGHAVDWLLRRTDAFALEHPEEKYIFAVTRGGWLRRVK